MMSNSKVVYEGWMVRYGRRKIGRSFIHMRYFVLESRLLAYYKRKPQDNVVPIKTLVIDGNCRVEDRGLKTQQGLMVYVLSIYNKKEKYHRVTMAAFNIQEALIWKEKIESVIDQHQESLTASGNKYQSFEYKSGMDSGRNASSSDQESQYSAAEDEDDLNPNLLRRTTIGNGPPESILDWTQESSALASQNTTNQAISRKHWRLLQCQNGLRIFEELLEVDFLPKSCSRAMKATGVVEASCEEIFELVMSMDGRRSEWDSSFQDGSLVEEVDGHTALLYHRLQLDWFPTFVWPRDLCYVRYWRRNDDGSYVVLFCSREHENCGPQPGYVRAHIESGGFNISPLKPRNGRPRTQVQHLMQIDLKGWGVGYISSFQQHCLLQMLNSVAGLREYFAQTDERTVPPRIPVMVNMASCSVPAKDRQKNQLTSIHDRNQSLDNAAKLMDEYSDEDEDFQIPDEEAYHVEQEMRREAIHEGPVFQIDLSCFSGNLRRDDNESGRDCWRISDGSNFRVRSRRYCYDKTKMPGGNPLMDLVAVDWFKDTKRMDHVARRPGCVAQVAAEKGNFSIVFNLQVPGSTNYSMVFYFVTKELLPGSLLQRFVDGDDEFRNSRMKLIPSVPKGSWIVRQSVGSTPCLLGKAVDCNYIREANYLEVDVDIGSSTVANGVLGLVIGAITSLVVDMAFLVQANTTDELPERLIGAVRVSHLELKSAIVPTLESDPQPSPSKP
ncbi:protein ENHANCED DISEASE RESISTANCE 2-like [Cynara cardunculus var. scolymus]|uniref:protein ENHANCED DISEASE RESISTANCE 2-like n=1 Tax=Cynara cardunculus var. scolymus TaxID=59895 RepID=UPI000D627DD3|nr:protein ENHANCED DISEASE RESISTANCE 2-like [Cynara cardunculus var. scolymus]XP_024986001.1 protein ENHANCED DISEASE RESISTANCE 2-like [Cynara cardunculus var. scolymus]